MATRPKECGTCGFDHPSSKPCPKPKKRKERGVFRYDDGSTYDGPKQPARPNREPAQVQIPDELWEENGNEGMEWTRLIAQLTINGVHFHVEAIAIEDNNGVQTACASSFESNLNGLAELAEPSGAWDTMEIRGREYVVFATPHC